MTTPVPGRRPTAPGSAPPATPGQRRPEFASGVAIALADRAGGAAIDAYPADSHDSSRNPSSTALQARRAGNILGNRAGTSNMQPSFRGVVWFAWGGVALLLAATAILSLYNGPERAARQSAPSIS